MIFNYRLIDYLIYVFIYGIKQIPLLNLLEFKEKVY